MCPTKFNLQRFLDAQEDMYPVALKEMKKVPSAAIGFGISFLSRRGWDIVITHSTTVWMEKKRLVRIYSIRCWVRACGRFPVSCWHIADTVACSS